MHGFCLDLLSERGESVGVDGVPAIFEHYHDRKQVLLKAISDDPVLGEMINEIPDVKLRSRMVDDWLQTISRIKAHPISQAEVGDVVERRVVEAYDAGMRASHAYDFDDLLVLAYRLLTSSPQLASFYRRLYRFICVDEAQDLNEAQYAVLQALAGGGAFSNVMLVGDPRQSIYGFNTSSPKYMDRFRADFNATVVTLTENFRSSRAVVSVARSLESGYMLSAQLPIDGSAEIIVADDEKHEARLIADELARLLKVGHPDVEGLIDRSRCAVLGRSRFVLLGIEAELRARCVPYYKRVTSTHENASGLVTEFDLGLRVLGNEHDELHLSMLLRRWAVSMSEPTSSAIDVLKAASSASSVTHAMAVANALVAVHDVSDGFDLMPSLAVMRSYGSSLSDDERRAVGEDVAVLEHEWDQYLRSGPRVRSIAGFMSSRALGATQRATLDGVGLLTVHASKGLEFDVVFIAGMAEGTFPDYRATGAKELAEEGRNAFVAVTRCKRLLYLTYPKSKLMPWGDPRHQTPSRFLRSSGLAIPP